MATTLVAAVASSSLGCATFRKEALRKEGASAYVYPKPIEKLWPDVQRLLKDEGYGLRAGRGYTLVIDPKETSPGSGQWITLLVQGKGMDPGHSILRVFKKTRGGANLGGAQSNASYVSRSDVHAVDVATSAAGDALVIGTFQGGVAFTPTTDLNAAGQLDSYFARVTRDGEVTHLRQFGVSVGPRPAGQMVAGRELRRAAGRRPHRRGPRRLGDALELAHLRAVALSGLRLAQCRSGGRSKAASGASGTVRSATP